MNSIHPSNEEQWKVAGQKRGLFLYMEMDDAETEHHRVISLVGVLLLLDFPIRMIYSCSYEYFHDNHVDLIQSFLFSILFFAMSDYQTAHLHIGHREVVFAWRKRTRCVSFSGWPVFCSGSVFSWFSRGRKWAPLERASERSLRSPSLMPSSWLAVINRGILELTRDVYTDDRRILLLLWISRTNPKSF